jgi:transcriptional regulator with PAS, ATPase and Fis domain
MTREKFDIKIIREYELKADNEPVSYIDQYQSKAKYNANPHGKLDDVYYAKALIAAGKLKEAKKFIKDQLQDTKISQDYFCLSKYHLYMYRIYEISNKTEKSRQHLLLSLEHLKRISAPFLAVEVGIHELIFNLDKYDQVYCEKKVQSLMREATALDDVRLKLELHLLNGYVYNKNNMLEQAYHEFQTILEMIKSQNFPNITVRTTINLVPILTDFNKIDKADRLMKAAIQIATVKGYTNLLMHLRLNYGRLLVRMQDHEHAIRQYLHSAKHMTQTGLNQPTSAVNIYNNLANAYRRTGDYNNSLAYHDKSKAIAIKIGDKNLEMISNLNIANTLMEQRSLGEAEQHLNQAIEYFSQKKLYSNLAAAYRCAYGIADRQDDLGKSVKALLELDIVNQKYIREVFSTHAEKYQARIQALQKEYTKLKNMTQINAIQSEDDYGFLGNNPAIKSVLANAQSAAQHPTANVLIRGESGTGKELVARIVHFYGSTAHKPFIAVNASAISAGLLESELFGHKKGSFTGAIADKKGKFELAHLGSLFLDEISEMPVESQVKLLRAIETRKLTPVGSEREIGFSCRVISATNTDLADLIGKGSFRLDLYHRLNTVEIHIPPLRERKEDIQLLTDHYIRKFSDDFALPLPVITPEFYLRLENYRFPGNVRELKNIIERIFILKFKKVWGADLLDDLINQIPTSDTIEESLDYRLEHLEKNGIIAALNKANWVQKKAALILNMSESTLTRRIKQYEITKPI